MRVENALRAAGDTHPGLQRAENEDRFHYDPNRGMFLVDRRRRRSRRRRHRRPTHAVTCCARGSSARQDRSTTAIREAITVANNEIHRLASTRPEWKGMGCVLTVAVVDNGGVTVGHVGDTRLYKLRRGRDRQGHARSFAGRRARGREPAVRGAGDAAPAAQRSLPGRGRRAARDDRPRVHRHPEDAVRARCRAAALQRWAHRYGFVDGHRPCGRGARGRIRDAVVRALIDAANEAGGKDNVTVVYVEGQQFAGTVSVARPAVPTPPSRTSSAETPPVFTEPIPHRSKRWVVALLTALLLLVAGAAAWRLGLRFPWKLPALDLVGPASFRHRGSIGEAIDRARLGER